MATVARIHSEYGLIVSIRMDDCVSQPGYLMLDIQPNSDLAKVIFLSWVR